MAEVALASALKDVAYVDTGPSRRGYVLGALLWVAGLFVVFAAAYSMELTFNERAEDYPTVAVNQVGPVEVDEPGEHTVWIDTAVQAVDDGVGGSADQADAARRIAEVSVVDPAGNPVEVRVDGAHEYRARRDGLALDALAWGTFDAQPGTYQVGVMSPVPDVVGASVGPTPSPAPIVATVLGGVAVALCGVAVLLVWHWRRNRAARSMAEAG